MRARPTRTSPTATSRCRNPSSTTGLCGGNRAEQCPAAAPSSAGRLLRWRLQFLLQRFEIGDYFFQRVVELALTVHQVVDLVGLFQLRQLAVEQQPDRGQPLDVVLRVMVHLLELRQRVGHLIELLAHVFVGHGVLLWGATPCYDRNPNGNETRRRAVALRAYWP